MSDTILAIVIMVTVATCVTISTWWNVNNLYKNQAIERGYALHCPVSGDFSWKGECDE